MNNKELSRFLLKCLPYPIAVVLFWASGPYNMAEMTFPMYHIVMLLVFASMIIATLTAIAIIGFLYALVWGG